MVEKVILIGEKPVLISVSENQEQQLLVSILNQRRTQSLQEAVTAYVTTWFDLETDLKPFYKLAAKDDLLKPLVKKYFGYRLVSIPDLFECLCWAVIGQQINLAFAHRLKQRFVQSFGTKYSWKGTDHYLFPNPETVAKLAPADLLALQFSRQKAAYVLHVANALMNGTVSKTRLSLLSFSEARQALISIKGVGNWTANYVLMKTFRLPNAFLPEDAGLQQAFRKALLLNEKPSLQQLAAYFKKYTGWEAYATLYLWRTLGDAT